jgi:hypothetical protein
MVSMLALSRHQCPAVMSALAVRVLHGPRLGSLHALCMLSVFITCVLTGVLLTPEYCSKYSVSQSVTQSVSQSLSSRLLRGNTFGWSGGARRAPGMNLNLY